ncbi:MAG TPA: DUF488 family protein, partial [Steroidobacteraceae bacterium]|nr:DUF488 family protein [Steroidobacteraceae bacterium]
MALRVVRLGSPRASHEGLRLGTVRRPPRGVPKSQYAERNFFDVWLPILAPSADAVALALKARSEGDWRRFTRRYRREMAQPGPREVLALIAALSRSVDLSVGCYCADERRCHRSILRALLLEQGAVLDGLDSAPREEPRAFVEPPRTRPP